MPVIMNCLDESNECRLGGNTFSFKPRGLKYFHDAGVASAIGRLKQEDGFVILPEECDYLAHLKEEDREKVITPEHRSIIDNKRKEGVNSYCTNLRRLVYNATVSLQKDIDRAGYKYDARVEATGADLRRLETLSRYQAADLDLEQKNIDRFKELEKKVAKTSKA